MLGSISALELSRREISEKKRQIDEDLAMAREVQLAMLPRRPLFSEGDRSALRLAHEFVPASAMSGDFFDVLRLSDCSTGILVCDVMGHGVRSALVAAMVRAMMEPLRPVASDPAAFLTRLNTDLTRILRQTGGMIFVTAAYAVFDLEDERVIYAQAGHPTPLRWERLSGRVRPLSCPAAAAGPALGLMDAYSYQASEEPTAAGDRWLFFTDGVVEAASPAGEEFGVPRLAETFARASSQSLEAELRAILDAAAAFCAEATLPDDVCLVGAELSPVPWY
jgi:serine phosphatase RsbU (regulator of sigma subunit)